jgi:SAM-dependent methyltransferase
MTTLPLIDEARIEAFMGQVAADVGAAVSVALVSVGDRIGLYRAMGDSAPVTAAVLAERTGTHERYVREWLNNQAAGGYVTYDPAADTYTLPPEHAYVLADETSPLAKAGMFQAAAAAVESRDKVAERFLTGGGLGWHEHHDDMFHGTERAFGSSYRMSLVAEWLPALDGVLEKLERGATVADVGCGHGASAILLAQAFPASRFVGFDYHAESIEIARERAREAGVADRVSFEIAAADAYPAAGYDVVAFFDSLHDLGDPVGAALHAHAALADDGTCLVVEPAAGDRIEDNLNPVGRFYYGVSTLVCTPGSLSQPGAAGLGTQAGWAKLRDVLAAGGFGSIRRAAENPFNFVIEARR